jgi:hypothetical protein
MVSAPVRALVTGSPMTVRGGGVPYPGMVFMPSHRMGPPPRSLLPMRITASWFGSWPAAYKDVGTIYVHTNPQLPSDFVIPTRSSVPSCSKPSKDEPSVAR